MKSTTHIDVRPILAEGGCPFDTVLEVAQQLSPGETLSLTAPFNPVPLQQALAGIGVDVEKTEHEAGAFTVYFRFTPIEEKQADEIVDLTDLEPPEPMMKIMEALAAAGPGELMAFRTRFKPVHMLNAINKDETTTTSNESDDGTWITQVAKREVVRCEH